VAEGVFFNNRNNIDIALLQKMLSNAGFFIKMVSLPIENMDDIIRESKNCSALISGSEVWDKIAINKIKDHIKIIIRYAVGLDNIDVEHARECGIPVYNIAGSNSIAVAEIVLLHILNITRKFKTALDMVDNGNIEINKLLGDEIDGKVMGVVGFGSIAKDFLRIIKGFSTKIICYDPYVDKRSEGQFNVDMVDSIEEIFSLADIVSIHIPLSLETKGMINRNLFSLMKPGAILINTSRGGVINEEDLYEGLKRGQPAAAGLDVVNDEPVKRNNLLLKLKNVWLTPHYAAGTIQSELRAQETIAKHIINFFKKCELEKLD
jgi:phosphoglycerate dehydrogenase-like enzyme